MKTIVKYNLAKIMRMAWSTFRSKVRRMGRSFGECLKAAWAKEKSYMQTWATDEEFEKTKNHGYNNINIPSSAFYSGSKGYLGASYTGD